MKRSDERRHSRGSSSTAPAPAPRLVAFRPLPCADHYAGPWQSWTVASLPAGAVPLHYYNSSRTAQNSNLLQVILRDHGFERLESFAEPWNLWWCAGQVDPAELQKLEPHQRINKFPKASALTLKANLYANFARMQRRFGADTYDYMPTTFVLPADLGRFAEHLDALDDAERATAHWIVKPAAAYCGRGISVHRASAELPELLAGARGVVCRYIDPPFLLDGLKSDIRLYVLVTSWDPLCLYLHDEGLVRFATEPYNLGALGQRLAHLTNYSLNRHSANFVHGQTEASGSKWSLAAFRERLAREVGERRAQETWRAIDDMVVKAAASAVPAMGAALRAHVPHVRSGRHNTQCFQVFGFDVMLDAQARPWLIEVNLDPSLKGNETVDLRVKSHMLLDLLNLVGVPSAAEPEAEGVEAVSGPAGCEAENATEAARAERRRRREEESVRHVNLEYERSKHGGWRRLFPSKRSAEYLHLLERQGEETLHGLRFDT